MTIKLFGADGNGDGVAGVTLSPPFIVNYPDQVGTLIGVYRYQTINTRLGENLWHHDQKWSFRPTQILASEGKSLIDDLQYTGTYSFNSESRAAPKPYPYFNIDFDLKTASYVYNGASISDSFSSSYGSGVAHGRGGNDTLGGGANGADTLRGESGDDYLFGSAGDDLDGGAGDDVIVGEAGMSLEGGVGVDALELDLSNVLKSVTLTAAASDQLVHRSSSTFASGFEHFDVQFGGGNDRLDVRNAMLQQTDGAFQSSFGGGDGIDKLLIDSDSSGFVAFTGFEEVYIDLSAADAGVGIGNAAFSSLKFNATFDGAIEDLTVIGGAGSDAFSGGVRSNHLVGNGGADTLIGGDGLDTLEGGAGKDSLAGGAGADRFVFSATRGPDLIADFDGDDVLVLDSAVFDALEPGKVAGKNFKILGNGDHVDSNDTLIYKVKSGSLFYDTDGDGPIKSIKIGILANNYELTAHDILVA